MTPDESVATETDAAPDTTAATAGAVTTLRVTALTHRGAVREGNEDALVLGGLTAGEVEFVTPVVLTLDVSSEPVVVAVADGLGGHAAGEVAATYAARRLASAGPGLTVPHEVAATLVRISAEIEDIGRTTPSMAGLGTTVAGLVLGPPAGGMRFHVGDSRLYQVNGPCLGRLTEDDAPLRDPDGRITQFLGGPLADGSVHPHVEALPVVGPGTRWLLCTDGVSDLVPIAEMERIVAAEPDESRAVRALWVAAMNAGGHDNISIVAVTVLE